MAAPVSYLRAGGFLKPIWTQGQKAYSPDTWEIVHNLSSAGSSGVLLSGGKICMAQAFMEQCKLISWTWFQLGTILGLSGAIYTGLCGGEGTPSPLPLTTSWPSILCQNLSQAHSQNLVLRVQIKCPKVSIKENAEASAGLAQSLLLGFLKPSPFL